MPELPEAETIARQLDRRLRGATVRAATVLRRDVIHGDPFPLSKRLPGRCVYNVGRRAKRVVFDLTDDVELVFHLGMTGRLTLVPRRDPLEPHTHLRIRFVDSSEELRFCDPRRFGGVWCLTPGTRGRGRILGPLGDEPLELTPRRFQRILSRRRQIKALLLDQRVIAGLGNIYCDEALFAARVHPLTPADSLNGTQAGRLLRAIKTTLNRAIRHNGSTLSDYRQADGAAGAFQRFHRVYGRDGEPCRRCGGKIVRIVAAGRSSHLCPICQVDSSSVCESNRTGSSRSVSAARRRSPTRRARR